MKRPLFITGVAYLFAVRMAFVFDAKNALLLSAAAVLSAVLCFMLRDRLKHMQAVCTVFLAFAAAFASYALYMEREIKPVASLEGETVTIEGLITESSRGIKSVSYTMEASLPDYTGTPKSFPLIVRTIEPLDFTTGDTVRLRAKLVKAGDSLWYESRGISVIGQNVQDISAIPAGRFKYERALLRLRAMMAVNLYQKLSDESADVVSAMVLGQSNNISPEVYSAVGRAGTAHLLSVSGLHLSILSAVVLKSVKSPKISALLAILSGLFFVMLVGFSSSVLRSFVMTFLSLSGRLVSKKSDSLTSLGFALVVCCAVWPHWALGWGLWLSAGSTLGIILFSGTVSGALSRRLNAGPHLAGRFASAVAKAGGVGIAAYVFTLPLLLLMSGWISVISPLANVLITPFIPITIFGGIACSIIPGTPLAAVFIAAATDFATRVIIRVSEVTGSLPFSIAAIDESFLLIWLLGLCAFLAVLIKYRENKKLVAYACALLIACFSAGTLSFELANRNKLELVTLSGHNTAVLLRGKEAVILGAPDAYEISNLLRYLNFRGVKNIPALVAADCGNNVSSGVIRLSQNYKIGCVIGPNDMFICEGLEQALPGTSVYSGGYAAVTVLGGAEIFIDIITNDIYVATPKNKVVKMRRDYDIIEYADEISIYNEGVMTLPRNVPPAFEPVGAYLFGESRILLPV